MSQLFSAFKNGFSDLIKDSRQFRNNQPKRNYDNIPVQENNFAQNSSNYYSEQRFAYICEQNLLTDLTQHLIRGLAELPDYLKLKEVTHDVALPIKRIGNNTFVIRLEKNTNEKISYTFFHNTIKPNLNERMKKVVFNAGQEIMKASAIYREELTNLYYLAMSCNEYDCNYNYNYFDTKEQELLKEYNLVWQDNYRFLNMITFLNCVDNGYYADLYFEYQPYTY